MNNGTISNSVPVIAAVRTKEWKREFNIRHLYKNAIIKKPQVANAKNQQYKTAIQSYKVANEILKDLQINKLEEKLQLMEEGLIASVNNSNEDKEEASEETLEKIEKLTELTEALAELKE